jgi:hypothetical protein
MRSLPVKLFLWKFRIALPEDTVLLLFSRAFTGLVELLPF